MAKKKSVTKLSFKYPEYLPKESKTFRNDSPNVFYGGMELLFQFIIKLHKVGASSYSVFAFRYLSPAGISSGGGRPCGWHALRSVEGKVHGNAASLSSLATEACNGRFWRQRCCGRRIITLVRLAGPTFTLHRSVTSSARKSFQFGDKTEKT